MKWIGELVTFGIVRRLFPVGSDGLRRVPDSHGARLTWQLLCFGDMEPPKIGSDPDLARSGPIQAGSNQCEAILVGF